MTPVVYTGVRQTPLPDCRLSFPSPHPFIEKNNVIDIGTTAAGAFIAGTYCCLVIQPATAGPDRFGRQAKPHRQRPLAALNGMVSPDIKPSSATSNRTLEASLKSAAKATS
ncbi:MAG: hypothetical protein R3C44_03460 [Chloroflexota bacterium]